ncbi:MAG: hypothetical protein IKZ68_03725 [Bacilli bacterium]|nr:hypothetical protein [Bacilli bacterium]
MKNRLCLFGIASLIVLAGCGKAGTELVLYTDGEPIQDGDVTITINPPYEQAKSFSIIFSTASAEPIKLTFGDWKIVRESDNTEYESTCTPLGLGKEQTVSSERFLSLVFRAEIPTTFSEEHYRLVLNYETTTLTCHLYDQFEKSYPSFDPKSYK